MKLTLFGTMQARVGDMALPPLRSRKGDWLLALLAMKGSPVSRSWLAGTLWPESEESRALLYLRRELTFLRKALGRESQRLLSTGRMLQLDLAGSDCDLVAFDAAIARGDESSLELAVSLYTGPLLNGCDEEWVVLDRHAREQAYFDALQQLAGLASARGDTAATIRHLRCLAARDTLRESAHRDLMMALVESGDSAAALQVYHDLRRHLRRELNTDVDSETASVFRRIQVNAAQRQQSSKQTAKRSRKPRIIQIPVPHTPLVGRREELRELHQRLWRTRLLTLAGSGGVGKTRLAIEIASDLRDGFEDGVCFVELAALNEASPIAQAVMNALGLKADSRRAASEILAGRLRDSDLLLILDNCEHLIQSCAELSTSLLGACSKLRILATSREPLGISGESVWRVASLSVPPATDRLETRDKGHIAEAMEYESVTLFVERAQRTCADFRLTVQNVESVSRVCRRLDGIPLAIELAAARLRSLTVDDVESKLEHRFRLLTGGSRTALPRHQTLRALIDWSYDLLNESERALFCRLSVFSGGWTLEAAESVCAGELLEQEDILDVLSSLADKSLVVAESFGPSVRYRMLETMRQYASDRLDETGDVRRWRDRHLEHFLALAEEAEPHLTGAEQQQRLERLELDHGNIRAALDWCQDVPQNCKAGLRLAGAICKFWSIRGHNREGRDRTSRLLRFEPENQDAAVRAKALHGAGLMACDQGDASAASPYIEEELAIRRQLCDRRGIANVLNLKANVAYMQGDYAAALAIRQEGLAIWREIGDRWGIAVSLGNIAGVAYAQGDYASARQLLEESLAIRREFGVRRAIAHSLQYLGMTVHALGDHALALQMYEESLAIDRELGNERGEASVLNCLAKLAFDNGDFIKAWSHVHKSVTIHRELGDRFEIAVGLEIAAPLAAAEGACDRAARIWGAAERIREEMGTPRPPNELSEYRQHVTDARTAFGSDASFDAAWLNGRSLSLDEAVEVVLQSAGD